MAESLKFIDTIIAENQETDKIRKLEIGSITLSIKIIDDPVTFAKLRSSLKGRVQLLEKSYAAHPSIKKYKDDLKSMDKADRMEFFTKACLISKMLEEDIPDYEIIRLGMDAFPVFEELASAVSFTSRSKTGVSFVGEDLEEAGE